MTEPIRTHGLGCEFQRIRDSNRRTVNQSMDPDRTTYANVQSAMPRGVSLVRQIALRYLQHRASQRLMRIPGVIIHPTARVNARSLRHQANACISIGEGSMVEGSLTCERQGVTIVVGRNSFVGADTILASAEAITVGDDVQISSGCRLLDHNSHAVAWQYRQNDVLEWYAGRKDWTHVLHAPIHIEDKVWIGLNAIVLKGVRVGEGSIVGAGSVVTKSVPPWCMVAGNPARVLRELSLEERAAGA